MILDNAYQSGTPRTQMPGTVRDRVSTVLLGAGLRIIPALAALLVAAGTSGPSRAHPHVFIDGVTDVVFENGKITGIRQHWTFDDVFSLLLIEDFDANKNRKFDKPEIEALRVLFQRMDCSCSQLITYRQLSSPR